MYFRQGSTPQSNLKLLLFISGCVLFNSVKILIYFQCFLLKQFLFFCVLHHSCNLTKCITFEMCIIPRNLVGPEQRYFVNPETESSLLNERCLNLNIIS
jgi:hypothetical protein